MLHCIFRVTYEDKFYKDHFLRLTHHGIIQKAGYLVVHMSHVMKIAIGQAHQ